MSDHHPQLPPTSYRPLAEGRVAIRDQARIRGVAIPVHKTVAEIVELGFDVDPTWEADSVLVKSKDSPTGYAIINSNIYALITSTVPEYCLAN